LSGFTEDFTPGGGGSKRLVRKVGSKDKGGRRRSVFGKASSMAEERSETTDLPHEGEFMREVG
jgi:hypothetical protein